MAAFTTSSAVRLKFLLQDTYAVGDDVVAQSVDDAHIEILRRLDPGVDTVSPPDEVLLAETLLAGARLLASLASKSAGTQRVVTIGGQRIDPAREFDALTQAAARAEREAWEMLAPFARAFAGEAPATTTGTTPVLGGE